MHFLSAFLSLISLAVVTAKPSCDKHIYNQTFVSTNTAACIKDDLSCNFHDSACVGKVSCLGEGPDKCCVVNSGSTGDCDGSSEGQKEFTIEDGSPCYFKKGQSKTTFFEVCKSKCSPTSKPTTIPTGEPTMKPTFMPTKASCRAYTSAANLYNKSLSIANKAICVKPSDCNTKDGYCMGYIKCDADDTKNAAIKCCVANPGKGDEFCDGSTKGQDQYYLQNGAECYYKKGQKTFNFFQVCNGYKYCSHPTPSPTKSPTNCAACCSYKKSKQLSLETYQDKGSEESLTMPSGECGSCNCGDERRSFRGRA